MEIIAVPACATQKLDRILDMLHMILISHACYTDLVTKFNTTGATETRSWSLTVG